MKLDEIKKGFGEREIQPSAGAWDKLSAKLDKENKKSRKSYIYWIGAVAAVIVIALMVYPAINDSFSSGPMPKQQLVNEENDPKIEENAGKVSTSDNKTNSQLAVDIKTEKAGAVDEKEGSTGFANAPAASGVAQVTAPVNSEEKSATSPAKYRSASIQNITTESKKVKIEAIAGVEQLKSKPDATDMLTAQQEAGALLNSLLGTSEIETTEVAIHSIKPEQLLRETEWDLEAERRDQLNRGINQGLGILKNEAFALIGVDQ